jgi:hypothetical protein
MIIDLDLKYFKGKAEVVLSLYQHDLSPAILLVHPETEEPLVTASVCLVDAKRSEKYSTWIKDWSENEGMLNTLITSKVVENLHSHARAGFCTAYEVRLCPELREEFDKVLALRERNNA